MLRRLFIGITIIIGLSLYSGYAYLCLTAPVNPNLALEYKTLLVNEILKDSNLK